MTVPREGRCVNFRGPAVSDTSKRERGEPSLSVDSGKKAVHEPVAGWVSRSWGVPVTQTECTVSATRRFGRYTLVRPIGRGGMAEIWKARIHGAQNFERQMVVKRILPHLCLDPELVTMFTAEAMLSAQLNHANIVQVFEFAENEGELYLAMEYVHGVNLAELLKRLDGVPIPIGMAAHLVREVSLALAYAHGLNDEQGRPLSIIHRDVSPSNVMVGYDGSVKLVDFGVAVAQTGCENTRTGALKGKMAYMSPEAIDGDVDLDGRNDIFAAGVLLHELLTARRLFRAHDDAHTMALVRACKIKGPSRERSEVPAELDRIVIKALARDRRSRHATADELAAELTRLAADFPWDKVRTAAFLRDHGIEPQPELPRDEAEADPTVRSFPFTETKRITVVERRLRSGSRLTGVAGRRRLRWALTGAAAALALVSGVLAAAIW